MKGLFFRVLHRRLKNAQANLLKVRVKNIVLVFTRQPKLNEEDLNEFGKNVLNFSRLRLFLDQILNVVVNYMARIDAYLWVRLLKEEKRQLHDLIKLVENTRINLVDFVHFLVELLLEQLHLLLFGLI